MTPAQKKNYNKMRNALIRISKGYQTPDQIYKKSQKDFGLDYVNALEMSYDNIKEEAQLGVKNIRAVK